MPDAIEIRPTGPLRATIRPPGSKSITNRALVCAALAEGESLLTGALDSEDTRVMIEALRRLGIAVEHDPAAATIRVVGCGGRLPADEADLYVANSGTTMRFLTAMLAARARHLSARRHAADARAARSRICWTPCGNSGPTRSRTRAAAARRSWFAAAGCRGGRADGRRQHLQPVPQRAADGGALCRAPTSSWSSQGDLVSRPYVDMTLARDGVVRRRRRRRQSRGRFIDRRAGQRYRGRRYAIEPDASAASYFFAAAAITQGEVTVEGLSRGSLQGDVAFCDCLRADGLRRAIRRRTRSPSRAGRCAASTST